MIPGQFAGAGRGDARAGGFTLIEIAVVIIVLALLFAIIAGIATAMVGQQRREATRQRLAGAETAIALFVSQNLRLPCPADGRLDGAGGDANLGLERPVGGGTCAVAGANTQTHGVVPWRTLGLSEQDITDGWGNRMTYRVSPDFVKPSSMNMTYCDPGGTEETTEPDPTPPAGYCLQSCTPAAFVANTLNCRKPSAVTAGRGLKVQNLAGTATMDPTASPSTGAAYVVISHGENRQGAYGNQGILQAASGTASGTEEASNAADLPLAPYYVDDFPSYVAGSGYFDDFVLRPSILAVATRAQLGPRAH